MKAMIATGLGVLVLGGLLVANSGRSASAQSSLAGPAIVSQSEANRTTLVNCGEGRQAMVYSDPRTGASQVQCVAAESFAPSVMTSGLAGAMPVSQFAPAIVSPAQVACPSVSSIVIVRSRRPRIAAPRSRVHREPHVVRGRLPGSAEPAYSRGSAAEPVQKGRSWKKSAVIIGGATAVGAGAGAVLGGKDGAKKGAVVGLLGGTIYDIATRNK